MDSKLLFERAPLTKLLSVALAILDQDVSVARKKLGIHQNKSDCNLMTDRDVQGECQMKKPLLCSAFHDFSPTTPQIWIVLCYRQNSSVVTFLTEDVPLEVSAYAHLPTKHARQGDDTDGHHQ